MFNCYSLLLRPHYCTRAPLTRITLRIVFVEIFRNVERFERARPVGHLLSNFIAGIKHMPVVAHLRPDAPLARGRGASPFSDALAEAQAQA